MDIPAFYRLLTIFRPYIYSLFNLDYYSIVDLQGRTGINGEKIYIDSYYANGLYTLSQNGGWRLVFKSTQAKSGHNGVTVHSPTVPWDGTQSGLAAYQAKTGETDSSGYGCWVLEDSVIHAEMAGAIADCNGHGTGTDSTGAIKKALSTGRNVYLHEPSTGYMFKIKDMITVTGTQKLYGDGRTKSKIYVDDDFNLSADAVVLLQYLSTGMIDDIGIEFYQDTTITLRANLIAYPYAIKGNTSPMARIGNIRLSKAYNGVWLSGNSGGMDIGRLELGCLNKGLLIDGSLDFIHIESIHHWPFDFTGTNLYTSVYLDGNVTAFECGKCDGLAIDKLATFGGKVVFTASTTSYIPKIINTLQLDGNYSTFENDADYVEISKVYSTKSSGQADPSLKINSGLVMIGLYHHKGTRTSGSDVLVDGGHLKIASGHSANLNTALSAFEVTSGTLDINDVYLDLPVSARTAPYIKHTGGIIKVTDCDANAGGSGLGEIISVASDDASNKVQNNNFSDWTVTIASGAYLGVYGPNRTGPISYTPTVSFVTNGDFAPTYSTQVGRMWYEANGVRFEQRLIFTCNAYATASGDFMVSGPPVTFKGLDVAGQITCQGYGVVDLTAGRSQLGVTKQLTTNNFKIAQSGDNIGRSFLGIANIVPSAASVEILIAGYIPTK